jgi:hypothetical protein
MLQAQESFGSRPILFCNYLYENDIQRLHQINIIFQDKQSFHKNQHCCSPSHLLSLRVFEKTMQLKICIRLFHVSEQ